MNNPKIARAALISRDGSFCPVCEKHKGQEVDHRVPLIDGGSFMLTNLQLLCLSCHKVKTAKEASTRAQRRKGS